MAVKTAYRVSFDAAYPPQTVPQGATVACIYAGGDTPNPIADPFTVPVYMQAACWLPGWVRSNPTPTKATADGHGMVAWLIRNLAPQGCSTFLDLETAVTPAYVAAYGALLHAAGFRVLPYTSRTNMQTNPALDGYFVADPTDTAAVLYPGSVATQYAYDGTFDLSVITDAVPLWPVAQTPPTPAPTPPAQPAGGPAMLVVRTAASGAAYLVSGGRKAPIYDEATVLIYNGVGIPTVNLAAKDFGGVVAAFP